MRARDFKEDESKVIGGWGTIKPTKMALEQLFMQGDLMVVARNGFEKVYDLCERVVPSAVDVSTPSMDEYLHHLIMTGLIAQGLLKPSEIGYLRKGLKAPINRVCQQLVEQGDLVEVTVLDDQYFALADYQEVLKLPMSRKQVKILSPFDNLVIQRKRLLSLFDFDYQIECYLPAQKRKYGYFSLPLLWGQEFAGRLDAKIHRKSGVLHLARLHIETPNVEAFTVALKRALTKFIDFNQGDRIETEVITSAVPLNKSQVMQIHKTLTT
jgi:uncharacterized protein YcaQ